MKKTFFCCFLICGFSVSIAQTSFTISKPDLNLTNNVLTIKYDISGCEKGEYVDIYLILLTSNGDTLKPKYITGDIGRMISCGQEKTIRWNLTKDNFLIDDDIEAIIKGVKSVPMFSSKPSVFKRPNIIISSLFLPGLGQKKASGKSGYLIFTGLVYGTLGTALYLNYKSNDLKQKYDDAGSSNRDAAFRKWQDNYNLTRSLFFAAGGAWAANIIWSALIPIWDNSSKRLKLSLSSPYKSSMAVSANWNF